MTKVHHMDKCFPRVERSPRKQHRPRLSDRSLLEGAADGSRASFPGYYGEGLNAIIVFAACYLPDSNLADYHYIMENLFL